MATGPTLTLTRGDDRTWTFRFWTVAPTATTAGTPADLTGTTFYFTVKLRADDEPTDANAIIQKTIVMTAPDPVHEVPVTVIPADSKPHRPKEYFYDLQMKDTGGKISTPLHGTFSLEQEITNRAD